MIYCNSRIGMLESQLGSKETESKEQAIMHERELAELKRIHDVRSCCCVCFAMENNILWSVCTCVVSDLNNGNKFSSLYILSW